MEDLSLRKAAWNEKQLWKGPFHNSSILTLYLPIYAYTFTYQEGIEDGTRLSQEVHSER